MLRRLQSFLRAVTRRDEFERGMDDELRFHLEARAADLVRRGLAPHAAMREARREFGNTAVHRDRCRDARRITVADDFVQDLRFAVRAMRKDRLTSLTIVGTLALGIGATAAMFSAVNAALLRPLPFDEPDRLGMVFGAENEPLPVFGPDFTEWRAQCRACAGIAAFAQWQSTIAGGAQPERVLVGRVTPGFFSTIGVQPMLGRSFLEGEGGRSFLGAAERPVEHAAVVLGAALWRRQFHADPAIVGRTVRLDGDAAVVVGIMPDGFAFPDRAEAWAPATVGAARDNAFLRVLVRLAPDVTPGRADTEFALLLSRLQARAPDTRRPTAVHVVPLQEYLVGDVRTSLAIFLVAVTLVLLIACANVANLLLAQAATRPREIAMRTILGAGRGRLVRQLLTESLALAIAGGALGVAVAYGILEVFRGTLPAAVPQVNAIAVDGSVLAFVAIVSVATGILFGLAPAWRTASADYTAALKSGGTRGIGGPRAARLRGMLVVAEVSLALVLLVGAGLLVKSFLTVRLRPLGFQPAGVIAATLTLNESDYRTVPDAKAFLREVLSRIGERAEIQAAGIVTALPLARNGARIRGNIVVEGETHERRGLFPHKLAVGGDYFRTLGITLLQGRLFDARDSAEGGPVAIVSQSLAARMWPGRSPIGRHVNVGFGGEPWRVIVGVVADVKQDGLKQESAPALYQPIEQVPDARRWQLSEISFVMRGSAGTLPAVQLLRSTIQSLDRNVPLYDVASLDDVVSRNAADPRFYALMMGGLSLVALVLAVAGVYSVVSRSVRQRTHEIGVRMALGARGREVVALVLREGFVLVGLGTIGGLAGAYAATRALKSFLFRVDPADPATFVVIPLLLGAVALVACYIPARRATSVDPLLALRYE